MTEIEHASKILDLEKELCRKQIEWYRAVLAAGETVSKSEFKELAKTRQFLSEFDVEYYRLKEVQKALRNRVIKMKERKTEFDQLEENNGNKSKQ